MKPNYGKAPPRKRPKQIAKKLAQRPGWQHHNYLYALIPVLGRVMDAFAEIGTN